MEFETVISQATARDHLDDASWLFVDCRFFIREPDRGEREHEQSHIAGSVYAHLDRDLSGPIIRGKTGRHPLPSPRELASAMRRLGVSPQTQVVAYDESTGGMAAARLWWLLRWAGHDRVAVLDGGFTRWCAMGFPRATGVEHHAPGSFAACPRPGMAFDADDVLAALDDPRYIVLDARAEERYRGVNETIDPVAGHIKGAFSAPYMDNLRDDGCFKSPRELGERFEKLAENRDADHTVFYCGSGVTAAHNILAFAVAGRGMAKLYPGSWSEWIIDPRRPIAVGGS